MSLPLHPRLTRAAIRDRYNRFTDDKNDPWHQHTARVIRLTLQNWWPMLFGESSNIVLNAGSGGDDLGICPPSSIHLDLAERRLPAYRPAVVGSIECLPLLSESIDVTVCVGSVLNYCDPAAAIAEFRRVSRGGARLVIEFESSRSAELFFTAAFGRAAAVVTTFYGNSDEVLWAYRPEYIQQLLTFAGFRVVKTAAIHVSSPWALLLFRSLTVAARLASFERRFGLDRLPSRWASNHLWLCERLG